MSEELVPAEESQFTSADRVIWEKFAQHKVLDEVFSLLTSVPKWARLKWIKDKEKPRPCNYAHPTMTDAQAMEEGFSLNPQWVAVREKMIPLVMKYQITRSAGQLQVDAANQGHLPAPENQDEVENEILERREKRKTASKTQAEALERLRKKRPS